MKKIPVFQKVLFIHSGHIGEFLLSLPAIKVFRANHPRTKIYLMADKDNIDLVRRLDFIDYFVDCAEYYQSKKGTLRLAKFFKGEKIDMVAALSAKKYFNCAAWLARLPLRVGYDRAMGFFLNRKIKDTRHLGLKHESEHNIDLIRPFCPRVSLPKVEIPVEGKESLEFLKLDLSCRYVFIHPFSDDLGKQIDVIFWLELIRMVKTVLGKEIVLIGAPADKAWAKYYQETGGMHNVVGRLRLVELAALIKHNCALFVGVNAGPMHLAAYLGVPTAALFRFSSTSRWAPLRDNAVIFSGKQVDDFRAHIPGILALIKSGAKHG